MIKEFDTMFPRCLFLAKNTNYKEITDRFKLYYPCSEGEIKMDEKAFNIETFSDNIVATVYLAKDIKNKHVGYLVIINSKKFVLGKCAHEASHVCKFMEDYFGLERDANEYRAYMTEWYTNRIYDFWSKKI